MVYFIILKDATDLLFGFEKSDTALFRNLKEKHHMQITLKSSL